MAIEFLNEGATSLAAANWSGSGFADNATLIIDKPFGAGAPITSDVDFSSLTTGIDYLDIKPGAIGTIRGLKVDADSAAGDYIRNHGRVRLEMESGGGAVNNFDCGVGSVNYVNAGTYTNVTVNGGYFEAGETAVITNIDLFAGNGRIRKNGTDVTLGRIYSGSWLIERPGIWEVHKDADVTFEFADDADATSSELFVDGGRTKIVFAAFPEVTLLAGMVDESVASRPFTLGGTLYLLGGASVRPGDGTITRGTVTRVGVMSNEVGSFLPA